MACLWGTKLLGGIIEISVGSELSRFWTIFELSVISVLAIRFSCISIYCWKGERLNIYIFLTYLSYGEKIPKMPEMNMFNVHTLFSI